MVGTHFDFVRTRGVTIAPIAEKGLPSARPAAKANALEALLLCVELDSATPVIEELLPFLSHKQPKVIAATLAALTAIYHNYGCKIVDPKPVLKSLPKVFGHADKNVRAEAQNLTVEFYRWLKDAIKPVFWAELKPVQQQDLEKLFDNVRQEAPPTQQRYTRAQQEAMASAPPPGEDGDAGAGDVGGGEDADEDGEELDLAEPVDVMPKVPKDLHERLSSSKWKDRKEALDDLYNALNVPRIKDAPFDDVVKGLAKSMKDANVAVVTVAANCVDLLGKGLRKDFGKYRSLIMAPMLERLKEKKQSVADALGQALDAVFASTSLSECLEDILEFLKHKNPQVKQETARFLIRCLRTTRDVPSKAEVKSIAEASTKLLTESSEVIRSAGAEALGTLMKIMGERAMNPYLDGLDDIRKTKIKEYFETAVVKAKDRPKPIVAPPKAAPGGSGAGAGGAKKAPAGAKKPTLGLKKPAAGAAPPPVEDPAPSPQPQPKPAPKLARPGGLPKPGGLATPGSGLKMQRRIPAAGAGASQGSPQRRPPSPREEEPAPAPAPAAPKFGLGRGLAGRPISKPSPAASAPAPAESSPAAPAATPAPVISSGLSAVERAELEELRMERDRLVKLVEDLRSEKQKLSSQVMELQNQNAQLIEDHTRDVLSIKAKETQLVRARSDAEAAEQTVQKQQREIERLKRELSRALRAGAMSPPNPELYGMGGVPDMSPLSPDTATFSSNGSRGLLGSRYERPSSYMSNHSEDKENAGLASPDHGGRDSVLSRRKISPPMGSGYSGRGSPSKPGLTRYGSTGSNHTDDLGSSTTAGMMTTRSSEPGENWKRAAEVTSQLKARIEQMKVCFRTLGREMVVCSDF